MLDLPLAQFKNLRVEFQTKDGPVVGVEEISFEVSAGETVCVVGESGPGKSVSSHSLTRLAEFGGSQFAGEQLLFDRGVNVDHLPGPSVYDEVAPGHFVLKPE